VILVAADALKAPLASPNLTGVPVAPTAAAATNTTQIATTAFVDAARVILVAADALKAPLASPTFTGTVTLPAGAVLATPASITLTNANGTAAALTAGAANAVAVGNITGTGTGVATALAVSVGTAGSAVVNGGALGTPASGTLTNATGLPTTGLLNAAVTFAKIQNIPAISVFGNSGTVAGAGGAITATDINQIVRINSLGDNVAFGSINLAASGAVGTSVLSVANGGTGDAGTAWSTYTSTFAATAGTATIVAKRKIIGKTVFVNIWIAFTSAVTGTFTVTLPVGALNGTCISGKETALIGVGAAGFANPGSASLNVLKYDGTQFLTNGTSIFLTGSYESA
jgi:hypothetical protein